jgi:hypothetical protein
MTRDLSDVIARLSAGIAAGHKNPHYRRAAALTGGVPVYADIGGILVIARDGEIVSVDIDEDVTKRESDKKWRLIALATAARTHPELAGLCPQRPASSRPCDGCGGTGRIEVLDSFCGHCSTLGWVTASLDPLDDLIALSPRGEMLRRDLRAMLQDMSTESALSAGIDVVSDRSAVLCALFCHLRSPKSRHVRSVVENDLLTGPALWLQVLRPRFRATQAFADLDDAARLLTDIWTAIAAKSEQLVESVVALLVAGHIVSAGLYATYHRRAVLGSADPQLACLHPVSESLRGCETLRDLVREVRRQLGLPDGATR